MAGSHFKRCGKPKDVLTFSAERDHISHLRFAFGKRASLVESNRRKLAKTF